MCNISSYTPVEAQGFDVPIVLFENKHLVPASNKHVDMCMLCACGSDYVWEILLFLSVGSDDSPSKNAQYDGLVGVVHQHFKTRYKCGWWYRPCCHG